MHTAINQIIQQFFRKDNLEQVTEEELRQFVADYPYTTVGHLLLAKKEYDSGRNGEETLRDTALFINNPLWLQWILDDSRFREQKDVIIREKKLEIPALDPMSGTDTAEELSESTVSAKVESLVADDHPNVAGAIEEMATHAIEAVPAIGSQDHFVTSEAEADDTGNIEEETVKEMQVFQSYHTVDYFASQGIKLHPADLGKDKLGQQLRSFTDWLRSMKKLPQNATGEEDPSEQTVRVIAEHSIEEREVLTEAMAEVWAKQGNRQKAGDIYRKLSLLNPSKSAYFAAKIDQL